MCEGYKPKRRKARIIKKKRAIDVALFLYGLGNKLLFKGE